MDSFGRAVEAYQAALLEFVKEDAGPVLQMVSQREDVVLLDAYSTFLDTSPTTGSASAGDAPLAV